MAKKKTEEPDKLALVAERGEAAKRVIESEYFKYVMAEMRKEISVRKGQLGPDSFEAFQVECHKVTALSDIERRINSDIAAGKKATEKMANKPKKGKLV